MCMRSMATLAYSLGHIVAKIEDEKWWEAREYYEIIALPEFEYLSDAGCLYEPEKIEMSKYFENLEKAIENREWLDAYDYTLKINDLIRKAASRLFEEKLCKYG